jgi:DNA-binding CsgD family transcriptional regulator
LTNGHASKVVRAHRFAWELEHGPLPKGARLKHRCATLACVRPSHLEVSVEGAPLLPTRRQLHVLERLAAHGGQPARYADVAQELGISPATVQRHMTLLRRRLGLKNTQAALRWWHERAGAPRS